ncbi:DUF4476 domain-containing protein [Hymenobacter sp.]|uniref:DUF4476 domain-containing protein n=1 Tax=Hymenobacter sp. TaxID=1898978 RepID=UPI00286C69A6|nr:DUF4476 domain-containing protein [Hymenobacter sp.]
MKKVLLFALAGLFAAVAPALAHPPVPANVNFASERGVPFGLVLDGRLLTRGLARQVHVDRLVPGLHWADFSVPTAYGGAVRFRSRVWLEPGLETTFVLIARPGRALALRQVNAVALYGPSRGRGNGYGYRSGDGYGGGRYNSPTPYDRSEGSDDSSYDDGRGGDDPRPAGPTGYGNAPTGGGYYPGSAASSYRTLSPQDVDALVQAVQQRPFEASKLSTAKEALAQSSLQADDLKRLLRSLNFEASRVELAKFAHSHVADPQNFYRVYEAFDFDASAREVQQAVAPDSQR